MIPVKTSNAPRINPHAAKKRSVSLVDFCSVWNIGFGFCGDCFGGGCECVDGALGETRELGIGDRQFGHIVVSSSSGASM